MCFGPQLPLWLSAAPLALVWAVLGLGPRGPGRVGVGLHGQLMAKTWPKPIFRSSTVDPKSLKLSKAESFGPISGVGVTGGGPFRQQTGPVCAVLAPKKTHFGGPGCIFRQTFGWHSLLECRPNGLQRGQATRSYFVMLVPTIAHFGPRSGGGCAGL